MENVNKGSENLEMFALILEVKRQGKRALLRPRSRCEANTEIYLTYIPNELEDSSGSGRGLVAGSFEHDNKPLGYIKGENSFTGCECVRCSVKALLLKLSE
jgi:hypothetical protein